MESMHGSVSRNRGLVSTLSTLSEILFKNTNLKQDLRNFVGLLGHLSFTS